MSNKSHEPPSTSSSVTASGSSAPDLKAADMIIELPFDTSADDIRYEMLNDYEKCLSRHDVTLTDLLRLHQKQHKATNKLTLNLEQAKKREENERKKAEGLKQLLTELVKGVNDLNRADGGGPLIVGNNSPMTSVQQIPDDSKNMLNDLNEKRKADELRGKKDDVEKRCANVKEAKEGPKDEGKVNSGKELNADSSKIAQEIDYAKSETFEILRLINQQLAQLNRHLNTDYTVHEDPETSVELRTVLNAVLFDVSNMFEGKRRLDDVDDLKHHTDEVNRHVVHAEKMLAFLDREVAKLLAIGGRKETGKVDQKKYDQVIRFVEETFETMSLKKLRDQNKEVDKLNNERNDVERENDRRQKLHEQEMITKRAKIDNLSRQMDNINFQTELLRNELRRAPRSPVASESDTKNQIEALKLSQIAIDRQQIGALEGQLQRAKAKNDDALKQLKQLTNEINDLDGKLKDKQREFDELKQNGDHRKIDECQKTGRLEKKISELTREIERLQKELQRARQPQSQPLQHLPPVRPFSECAERFMRTERELNDRLKELDDRLQRAEADRGQLLDQMRNLQDQYRNACHELNPDKGRCQDANDQFQEVLGKIGDFERKLGREQDNDRQMELENRQHPTFAQFQHATLTRMSGASSQLKQSASSGACPPQTGSSSPPPLPTGQSEQSVQDLGGASRECPPSSSQYVTQTFNRHQQRRGSIRPRTCSTPPMGSSDFDEQIRSLMQSKQLAEGRCENLRRKVEVQLARPKLWSSRSASVGSVPQSYESSIYSPDSPKPSRSGSRSRRRDRSKGHTLAAVVVQRDQKPSGRQENQSDKKAEIKPTESYRMKPKSQPKSRSNKVQVKPKRRQRSRDKQSIQVCITPEIQIEKRDGDNNANAKFYDVKGDLFLTIEPSTTESSGFSAESDTPKRSFSSSRRPTTTLPSTSLQNRKPRKMHNPDGSGSSQRKDDGFNEKRIVPNCTDEKVPLDRVRQHDALHLNEHQRSKEHFTSKTKKPAVNS